MACDHRPVDIEVSYSWQTVNLTAKCDYCGLGMTYSVSVDDWHVDEPEQMPSKLRKQIDEVLEIDDPYPTHLLKPRGGVQCDAEWNDDITADCDINFVTCVECLEQHETIIKENTT